MRILAFLFLTNVRHRILNHAQLYFDEYSIYIFELVGVDLRLLRFDWNPALRVDGSGVSRVSIRIPSSRGAAGMGSGALYEGV